MGTLQSRGPMKEENNNRHTTRAREQGARCRTQKTESRKHKEHDTEKKKKNEKKYKTTAPMLRASSRTALLTEPAHA